MEIFEHFFAFDSIQPLRAAEKYSGSSRKPFSTRRRFFHAGEVFFLFLCVFRQSLGEKLRIHFIIVHSRPPRKFVDVTTLTLQNIENNFMIPQHVQKMYQNYCALLNR